METTKINESTKSRLQYSVHMIKTHPPENENNIPIHIFKRSLPVSSHSLMSTSAITS